ncbi:MAG: site-specific integrase [Polyangiaceae bacterium]|nr:site-specific integrase [Polyangiaceae bacterium]
MASDTKQNDAVEKKQRKSTGVREELRRGQRVLVIDFRYRIPDGSSKGKSARYRHDAEVQTWQGARTEYRRRLAAVAMTGSPHEIIDQTARAQVVVEPEPPRVTFGDASDEWSADYVPTLKASTQRSFLQVAGYRFSELRGVPLMKFSAEHWRTVQAAIRNDGCCEATVRAAGIVLRSILRFAVERKHLERLPELPPLPRKADTELVTYTDEEVRKLLGACTCSRHRIAVLLICYAGLRTSEIRGLRGCDIDLHTRTLRVRQAITLGPKKLDGISRLVKDKPKGRNERTIPLHEEVYQELLMLAPLGHDALVCPNNQGKAWGHKGLYEFWTRLRKRAGVRKVARPVHAGRHYFGTALCRARANVRSVQKLLGHANLNTTMRYVHAVDKDLETAIGDLQALTAPTLPPPPMPPTRPTLSAGAVPDTEGAADSERRPLLTVQASNDSAAKSERRPRRKVGAA